MGEWNNIQQGFSIKVISLSVLAMIYIIVTIYYGIVDTKRKAINRAYYTLNQGYKETLVGLSDFLRAQLMHYRKYLLKEKPEK